MKGPLARFVLAGVLFLVASGSENDTTAIPRTAPQAPGGPDVVRYEGSFTVLESPNHGPELCFVLATSLPPRCSGLPIRNWDWNEVDGEMRMDGTIWGGWHVIGTYSHGALNLTERPGPPTASGRPLGPRPDLSPACGQPDVADPRAGEAGWQGGQPPPFDGLVTMWVSGSGGPSEGFVANVIVRPGAGYAATRAIRQRYAGRLCVIERDLPLESELLEVQSELVDGAARAVFQIQGSWVDGVRGAVIAPVWVVDEAAESYARKRWGSRVILEPLLQRVR